MKKDAWYAAIAAVGLLGLAGIYGLWKAPELADKKTTQDRPQLTASLPSPPSAAIDVANISKAHTILKKRDPFTIGETTDDKFAIRGLELPKLGPPVRFSAPDAQGNLQVPTQLQTPDPAPVNETTSSVISAAPAQAVPQTVQRPRGNLTLRGVFPSANGGRALVALPDGSVVGVSIGGVVGGWRVLGIRQGAIRLGRGQRSIVLAMPR